MLSASTARNYTKLHLRDLTKVLKIIGNFTVPKDVYQNTEINKLLSYVTILTVIKHLRVVPIQKLRIITVPQVVQQRLIT